MRCSCTACPLIAARKSPTDDRFGAVSCLRSGGEPPARRKPFFIYCLAAETTACHQGALMREKVVLAYSGGLDTSIIPWLKGKTTLMT